MLPSTVTIHGQKWTVKVVSNLKHEGTPCDGVCHHTKREIEVCAQVPNAEKMQILFHEMCHAALNITGCSDLVPSRTEEIMIRAIEIGVFPALAKVLRGQKDTPSVKK